MKYLVIIACLFAGCSTLSRSNLGGSEHIDESDILGAWYFYLGKDDFVILDLKPKSRFEVSVYSCDIGKNVPRESGSWSLRGKKFELVWPDLTKRQNLHSVSKENLVLQNPNKRLESYFRRPKYPNSGKPCEQNKKETKNS